MLLKYYGAENSKKEKAYIPIADVMRVFKPKTSSQAAAKFSKHSNLFMIEVCVFFFGAFMFLCCLDMLTYHDAC